MTARGKLPTWLNHYLDVPAYVAMKDSEDRVLWINERIAVRNGIRREEVAGCRQAEIWRDTVHWINYDLESLRARRITERVAVIMTLLGRKTWVRTRRVPHGERRLLLMSEDVTAEVQLLTTRLRELFYDVSLLDGELLGLERFFEPTRSLPKQPTVEQLTEVERQLLRGALEGVPMNKISTDLGISARVLEHHRNELKQRLHGGSLEDAIGVGVQNKLFGR